MNCKKVVHDRKYISHNRLEPERFGRSRDLNRTDTGTQRSPARSRAL
jgi:hypothetical protein